MDLSLRRIIALGVRIADDLAATSPAEAAPGWPGFREEDWACLSRVGVRRGSADAIFVEALARHAYEVIVSEERAGGDEPRRTRPGKSPIASTGIGKPMSPEGQPYLSCNYDSHR
ncbi:hypothetical protein OJF2_79380 (plasmid) [Aquisphaera giovannonii]|uniref:Uncharacterized protein n=1 Tax=Aquisphaera giovannonii TaxID=406548 RepID=A0A5B9WFS9_9BACT|nr:hypothetical protein OJF2_79380 [Aquisphaera giovannonii]